ISDVQQIIATPLDTKHPLELFDYLHKFIRNEPVATFIVGMPRQMDGTLSESAQHVVGFIRKLKREFPQIEVQTIDERFTSKLASAAIAQSGLRKKARQEKGRIDQVSAVILLQEYMAAKE